MNFIDYMLAPFVFIIREIFLFGYSLTGNYGVSIVLLSFAISLLLLPLFILIERSKKRDDAVKRRMKPLLDEIKRSYRGQERYYYIRTLHRQHGYSSFKSLVPVLTLLLQIPFFIAAYQFLEHYEPLAGRGFLFINDLSEPDRLLGSVNLLPIIMTVVNLVTACFYTRNGDTGERKQMLVVAGLFLVLLYNFPSGLVLYWTMNNVFSFFRLFITNPELFKKSERLSGAWKASNSRLQDGISGLTRGITGLRNGISVRRAGYVLFLEKQQWFNKMLRKPELHFSMLFLVVYFYLGSKYYFGGVHHHLGIIAFLLMVISQFTGLVYFINHYKEPARIWSAIVSIALLIILGIQSLKTLAYISGREIGVSVLNLEVTVNSSALIDIILPGILFISVITLFVSATSTKKDSATVESDRNDQALEKSSRNDQASVRSSRKEQVTVRTYRNNPASDRSGRKDPAAAGPGWPVYILSLLYLLGFIFLWNPVAIYASYPASFDFTGFDILKENFLIFSVLFLALTITYFLIPRRARHLLQLITTSAVILGFIHNTLFPIHLGTLQEAVFLEHSNLAKPVRLYLLEGFGTLGIFFFTGWLFKRGYHKKMALALIALNMILISHSLVVAGGSFFQKQNIPPDPSGSISFSKEKENIVLLILDMFHGWYVNRAIEEVPELKRIYDGFVWYPNSLAVSNITGSVIGPMLGGYDYTIDQLNKDANRTIEEKITTIASEFNAKIRGQGYRYSGNHIIYTVDDSLTYDTFLPKWHEQWDVFNNRLNIGIVKEISYTLLWNNAAFYTAPLILKPKIYNQGEWLQGEVTTNENTSRTMPYNFLRLLPHISNAESGDPNFIYLYTNATHHPWDIIDGSGIIQTDVTPYENNRWALETVADWLRWMKANEVYDNTKIIIVSDHGPHWWYFKGEMDNDMPVVPNTRVKRINDAAMSLFALMLVKDFHSEGELEADWRFMSNADVSAIIFDENDPTKGVPPPTRTLPASEVLWERKLWELNHLQIELQFEVTDDMYNLNNWKVVD